MNTSKMIYLLEKVTSGDVNNIIHQHNFFEGQFFEVDEKSVKHGENMVILRKTGILKWSIPDFCLGFLSP